MTEKEQKELREYNIRARLPQVARWVAVGLAALTVLIVVVGFYNKRNGSPFKFKPEHTQLSTEVVAEVNGYERLESDGSVPKYYIKADTARTFSDNHQELDNAYVRVYADDGVANDQLSAQRAVYVPEADKNFTAYLNGNVQIVTRDALKVNTETLTYTKASQLAETDEKISFERDNIRGSAFGASVKIGDKRLDLLKDVEIETFESPEKQLSNIRYAKLNADSASYDQATNRVEMNGGMKANIDSGTRKTDISSGHAVAILNGSDSNQRQLKQIELFDNVHILSTDGTSPAVIDAAYALFDKDADRFDLKGGTHIVTNQGGQPTEIRSTDATYERTALRIALNGAAQVAQGGDYVKGDAMNVELFPGNKVKAANAVGNAFLKQTAPERTTQVSGGELNIGYSAPDQMREAHAVGNARAELIPNGGTSYSKVTMTAPRAINIAFKGAGLLEKMQTDGRTTIQLDVPDNAADAANKRVTADNVLTYFNDSGKDIRRAEAIGNAELFVDPHRASAENYKTTINAPRFDCEFFPTGNNAKVCVGGVKTKTVRQPTVADKAVQTILADKLTANFNEATKDIQQFDATGNARYTEQDRNATAAAFTFTESDRMLRLRGGEPTFWDNKSRAKAREIDLNTSTNVADLRGGVSTTIYNASSMSGASPFSSQDKPVFVTADTAQFDRNTDIAVYTGNARGWQGDNFVRTDRLTIKQKEGRMYGDGNVQSGLFDAKMKRGGKESSVPVFATAKSMVYDREGRKLSYRDSVDIRQGTDRIMSESADVFLSEKNEVQRTIAERNVVITQPGRKAVGDSVQYTADDEIAILRGNPATVTDAESGGTSGQLITVYMRENRFTGDGRVRQNNNARVKSVYKVKPQ